MIQTLSLNEGDKLEFVIQDGVALIKNHCFHNGNKRTAALALLVFLKRNLILLEVTNADIEDMIVRIAMDEYSKKEIVSWIQKNSKNLNTKND